MIGIEKIIEQIEADADETARAMIDEAQNDAQAEKKAAIEKAEQQCAEIRRQSEKAVAASLERAKSAALLKKSKLVLSEKQALIGKIMAAAYLSLLDLPDHQYFATLLKMIARYALPQKGELHFSSADYARLPIDFQEAVDAVLENTAGSLIISAQTRPIDGGLVLVYGDIEVNCSFRALFDAAEDRLRDQVNQALF